MLKRSKIISVIILGLTGLFLAKAYYDTNTIEVKKYQISHPSLGEVLSGLKVAHLTDLHIKKNALRESKVIEILNQEKPDLILLTGDYIKLKNSFKPVLSFFRKLQAPLGVYAVMGNTDYYNENGSCVLCHKEDSKQLKENPTPVFIRNSHVDLKIKGKILTILGVDDPVNKKSDLRQSLKNGSSDNPSILLAHSPEILPEAANLGVDLVLSGHTHGGQIGLTKYLNKVFPLDPTLEFLSGFFREGRTLMYVNRGIGTSYLPFRFGVKPEITFLKFENPHGQSAFGDFQISNTMSQTIFAGLGLVDFWETINIFDFIKNKLFNAGGLGKSHILFDFESPEDLKRLDWKCHKWFELSKEHATSGNYSLKVSLPPGQYPGINFKGINPDWSKYASLKMDIFNPSKDKIPFHIRIDDHKSGWEYANRFDREVELKPGNNSITIPTNSLKTNLLHYPLNLRKIEGLIVFIHNNLKSRDLYIDNICLN